VKKMGKKMVRRKKSSYDLLRRTQRGRDNFLEVLAKRNEKKGKNSRGGLKGGKEGEKETCCK